MHIHRAHARAISTHLLIDRSAECTTRNSRNKMLTRPLYQVDGAEDEEESEGELFKRMTQIVEEEKEINQATMAELSGSAVKYGTVIHLQHVKTGLFVATQAKMIAEHERSCSAVMLQEKISSGCFFKVESRLDVSRLASISLSLSH